MADAAAAGQSILHALLFFLPAYVANMAPVLVAKVVPKWNAPIDGGRLGRDGQRLLGPGKTWRGLAGGTLLGGLTALAVALLAPGPGEPGLFAGWGYGHQGVADDPGAVPTPLWAVYLFGAILGAMALVGDAVKSYFKRRRGKQRGEAWVPFDQLDFVAFGLAAAFATGPWLLADGWLAWALLEDWIVLATLVVLTPLLHFLVNVVGYLLRLKEVPW